MRYLDRVAKMRSSLADNMMAHARDTTPAPKRTFRFENEPFKIYVKLIDKDTGEEITRPVWRERTIRVAI